MKKIYSVAFVLLFGSVIKSNAQVGIGAATPDNSAMLEVQSTAKGLLTPRLTQAQRLGISSPATGLIVYQTDGTAGFYYNAGTPSTPSWVILLNGGGNGSGLTNLNASNITSGTLSASVLPTTVTTQGNTFNGANQLVQLNGSGALPAVSGANLTALNASNLGSGTVPTARLGTGTANSTSYLRGDGTWSTVSGGSSLPSTTGNSGKFLYTDGTNTSWLPILDKLVTNFVTTSAATYNVSASDQVVFTSNSGTTTFVLPVANTVPAGKTFFLMGGTGGPNYSGNILPKVTTGSGNLIYFGYLGAVSQPGNNLGGALLISDGVSKYYCVISY